MTGTAEAPTLNANENTNHPKGTLLGVGPEVLATEGAALELADTGQAPPEVRRTVLPKVVVNDDARPSLATTQKARYRDLRLLGEGGVGQVALVEDQDIGRQVALKRLLPSMVQQGPLMRFVEEVRVMGSLEHPNIVPVHDVGVDGEGRLYIVMKKIDGETLEHVIQKLQAGDVLYHRRFPVEVRIEIFASLLRALDYAHSNGIIHRDIKPSNVMVGRFGEVVLMDWGIAKRLEDPTAAALDRADQEGPAAEPEGSAATARQRLFQTRNGTLLGTPAYMSPEQARGQNDQLDGRSDLYSLCVLFHEFMTLRHYLAEETTLTGLLVAVREREAASAWENPSSLQPRVPIEVANILTKGLEKDPEKRFQSAGELSEAVNRVMNGTFAVSCPLTFMRRVALGAMRSMNASPMAWMLGILVTVGLFVSGVVSLARAVLS